VRVVRCSRSEEERVPYREDLDAARAALKVADDMVHQRDLEILALHEKMHKQAYTVHTEPSAWDGFWATPWTKTILTGFLFANLLWATWAYYAGQEELRKQQQQHDVLRVKMKKERAITSMHEAGRLTVDVGDKRVLQSTTPSVSDSVTFSFTAKKTRETGRSTRSGKPAATASE
jgi:hypothetical protein